MAGDWIKVEKDTPAKPEILAISSKLGIHPDEVFGKCFRLWAWADSQTRDGTVAGITASSIDTLLAVPGFASSLVSVGWLRFRRDIAEFPNFNRHMGECAKKRQQDQERQRKYRSGKDSAACNSDRHCDNSVTSVTPSISLSKERSDALSLPPKDGGVGEGNIKRDPMLGFEAFYEAYPKHKAKDAAAKAWKKLAPDEATRAAMHAALEWQKRSPDWTKNGGQFIPYPASWLNAGMWKDSEKIDVKNNARNDREPSKRYDEARDAGKSG